MALVGEVGPRLARTRGRPLLWADVSSAQNHTWPEILGRVTDGIDLTAEEARWAMNEIMTDGATGAQIAAFGVGIKMKGAAPAELVGLAEVMLDHATLVDIDRPAVDIVGTGGDPGHAPARRSYEKSGYTPLPLVRYYKDL